MPSLATRKVSGLVAMVSSRSSPRVSRRSPSSSARKGIDAGFDHEDAWLVAGFPGASGAPMVGGTAPRVQPKRGHPRRVHCGADSAALPEENPPGAYPTLACRATLAAHAVEGASNDHRNLQLHCGCAAAALSASVASASPTRKRAPCPARAGRGLAGGGNREPTMLLHDDDALHVRMDRAEIAIRAGLVEGEGERLAGVEGRRFEQLRIGLARHGVRVRIVIDPCHFRADGHG